MRRVAPAHKSAWSRSCRQPKHRPPAPVTQSCWPGWGLEHHQRRPPILSSRPRAVTKWGWQASRQTPQLARARRFGLLARLMLMNEAERPRRAPCARGVVRRGRKLALERHMKTKPKPRRRERGREQEHRDLDGFQVKPPDARTGQAHLGEGRGHVLSKTRARGGSLRAGGAEVWARAPPILRVRASIPPPRSNRSKLKPASRLLRCWLWSTNAVLGDLNAA